MAQEKGESLAKSRLSSASDYVQLVMIPQSAIREPHGWLAAMTFRRSEMGCDAVGGSLISEVRPPGV